MRARIANAAGWMLLFRGTERVLAIVSTVALVRLLAPSDFGVAAMAMSVIAVIELFSAFSFDVALIQKTDPQRHLFDSAWTLNVIFALACAALIASLAVPAAAFFNEPLVTDVILVLAVTWALQGFKSIGPVHFRRDMDFNKEFVLLVSEKVIAFVVTIALAFWLRSYWALVIGILVQRCSSVVLSFAMHPFRPSFSLRGSRELFSFSSWLLVNNALAFLHFRFSHFFIGRQLGSGALGVYTVATDLANLITHDIIAPMNRAIFPGFSRMAHDLRELKRAFLDITAIIATLLFPAALGLATVADPLVRFVLGDTWLEVIPVVRVLAAVGVINCLLSHNYSAYLALGKTAPTSLAAALGVAAQIPLLLFLGSRYGLTGIVYAVLAALLPEVVVSFRLLFNALAVKTREYLSAVARPALAAVAMAVATTETLASDTVNELPAVGQLAVAVPLGAAIYLGVLVLLWAAAGRPEGAEITMWRLAARYYRDSRASLGFGSRA